MHHVSDSDSRVVKLIPNIEFDGLKFGMNIGDIYGEYEYSIDEDSVGNEATLFYEGLQLLFLNDLLYGLIIYIEKEIGLTNENFELFDEKIFTISTNSIISLFERNSYLVTFRKTQKTKEVLQFGNTFSCIFKKDRLVELTYKQTL